MKKLSLILIALFAVGFVIAQNTATINQFGSNIGSVTQSGGNDNQATIQQGFAGAAVTNNLNQPTGWKQGSYIQQIGSSNEASATVRTSANGTSIYQEGNSNFSTQEVGSTYHETTSLTIMGIDAEQIGNDNHATQKTIMSFGSAGIKPMTVYQEGNSNVADQVSVGGYGQIQRIRQVGDNNNNPNSSLNAFDLTSTTLSNPLTALNYRFNNGYGTTIQPPLTQYANQMYGSAIMNVYGNNNNTYQFQEYSVWSKSGRNNMTLDLIGNNNDVAQGQLGEYNNSDLDIEGSGNVVSTSQLGDSNIADVYILGSLNVVGVQQTGNLQSATVFQNGSSNFTSVVQQP